MNTRLIAAFLLLAAVAFGQNSRVTVTVVNSSAFQRSSETITVGWSDLARKASDLDSLRVIVTDQGTGRQVVTQLFLGSLLFQCDLKPRETRKFVVASGTPEAAEPKTFAGFMQPREDIAWENDRIAFRLYGPPQAKDVDNGFDVWTKRVPHLIVQSWYKGEEQEGPEKRSYHVDHGEGADFFSVGKTLGAGSCAPYRDGRLFQPGVFSRHRILATGPIRACFEVEYRKGNFDGQPYTEVKRITLDAGQCLNRIDVTYRGPNPIPFAAGIVKRAGVTGASSKRHGWVALWGPTNDNADNGLLGTAVLIDPGRLRGIVDVKEHLMILSDATSRRPATYYAGAGWTHRGEISSERDWTEYLDKWAARLREPVRVRIGVQGQQ